MPLPAGVALVTGASSGIGDALARELRSRGYGLIVAARREDRLQKLADELGETHVIACDLADPDVALTSAFLPSMVRRGSGAILNVASTAGLGSLPNSAGYSAAKHHSRAFSESLHHELRGQGIAVTALCPGPVSTDLWENAEGHPIEAAIPSRSGLTPPGARARALRDWTPTAASWFPVARSGLASLPSNTSRAR